MIYVMLAEGFEETEALCTLDVLRRAKLEAKTVGVAGQEVTGSHGICVKADLTADQMDLDKMDMVVLPGGLPGTYNLEASEAVQRALDNAWTNQKYIAAICAAPSILAHKGMLDNKTATCNPGFAEHLSQANCTGAPVEQDGKIITARGAGVSVQFGLKIVQALLGEKAMQQVKDGMVCDF